MIVDRRKGDFGWLRDAGGVLIQHWQWADTETGEVLVWHLTDDGSMVVEVNDAGVLWPKCDWKDFAAPLSFAPAEPTGDGVFYPVVGQDMAPLAGTQPPSTRPPLVDEHPRWKISGEVVPLFYDKDDEQWHIQGSA